VVFADAPEYAHRVMRSRIRWLALLALAFAAVGAVPGGGASDAGIYQIVGGTWVSGSAGQLVGPAWWLDGPTSTYGVTLVGPNGFTKHMGGPNQRFPSMPSTRSIYWCNETCGEQNPGGSWYAIGDGDHTNVSFTIDQSNRMQPVEIGQYSGDAETFTANWTADPSAQSFIVYIQNEGDQSATDWIVGEVLPGSATSVTFNDMSLNPTYAYEFDIFAFSGDIVNGPAPGVFNVASNRVDFVPSVLAATGPESGEPKPACIGCIGPVVCGGCDIITPHVTKVCSVSDLGADWTISSPRTACDAARAVFDSYLRALVAGKCSAGTAKSRKPCVVESYRCTTESTGDSTVRCASANRVMTFRLDLHG
jgi:hypothetical protein